MFHRFRLLLVVGLLVFGLDQATKYQALSELTRAFDLAQAEGPRERLGVFFADASHERVRTRPVVVLPSFLRLRYVENPGAAWGMFGSLPDHVRVPFFVVGTTFALGFILLLYRRLPVQEGLARFSLALVFGGALGNLLDRVARGHVIDFIDVHWRNDVRLHWPTFNVADVAISVGVALLLSQTFFGRQHALVPAGSTGAFPEEGLADGEDSNGNRALAGPGSGAEGGPHAATAPKE